MKRKLINKVKILNERVNNRIRINGEVVSSSVLNVNNVIEVVYEKIDVVVNSFKVEKISENIIYNV